MLERCDARLLVLAGAHLLKDGLHLVDARRVARQLGDLLVRAHDAFDGIGRTHQQTAGRDKVLRSCTDNVTR